MALPPFREYYSPIVDRPVIKWPNDARVAFWIAPNVEHYEYLPNWDGIRDPWPRTPHPDVQQYSYRDYGNRVGFWRMLEPLDKHNIRCTVSLNLAALEHFPEIAEAMMERNWEVMSHGFYNSEFIQPYSEDQERQFYRDSIDIIKRKHGSAAKGYARPLLLRNRAYPGPDGRGGFDIPHRLDARRPASTPQDKVRQDDLHSLFVRG